MSDKNNIKSTIDAEKQTSAPWGRFILLFLCPLMIQMIAYINTELRGSFLLMFKEFYNNGFINVIMNQVWGPYFFGTPIAWKIIGIYVLIELLFMKLLPGKIIKGPETINHNFPIYKSNGFLAFICSVLLYYICGFVLELFPPSIIHDNLIAILGALNASSLVFCFILYLKGRFFPTTNDNLIRGSIIADYYWGIELYPTIFGFHVKQFTNCRFGMMSWPLILLSYIAKQQEIYGYVSDSMLVSVFLQYIYVATFFYYEEGYFFTMDIQHDRAGFYLCWGCLLWVPCVYTSPAMYLVYYPNHLGIFWSIVLILSGILCFWMKTNANRQRLNVRLKDGNYNIWGHKAKIIRAKYKTEQGIENENILLVDGWWKVATHSHYLGEIFGALCWSLPGLFIHFMPYFYVFYLTILLCHRAARDDLRCSAKYGKYWKQYRKQVKYRVFPGIY